MSASDFPLTPRARADLERPEAYPGDESAGAGIERLQTHISFLFLTRERVYKFRRDVDLGFVRFDSRKERNDDCLREVALNRRLAPDVYLGVAPLQLVNGSARVGPVSEKLVCEDSGGDAEHCVVMRRLPAGRDALRLLERGELRPEQLDHVAVRVARFHDRSGLGAPAPFSREQWFARCFEPAEDCYRQMLRASPDEAPSLDPSEALDRVREVAGQLAECFEQRRLQGLAVDAHGDMHLEHIWFEHDDSEPLIIDCLEFSRDLREIDAASEIAFTAMDLRYRGAPQLAERYLRVYTRERDDFDSYAVVDYFESYRAAVRAKVAAIASSDTAMDPQRRERARESAIRHLEMAMRALERRNPGKLFVVGGAVGSGKSTVAEAVADEISGVVISTDRVRKRRLGLDASARADQQLTARLYTEQAKHATYGAVIERARPVLLSGRSAVLDGTFGSQNERRRALELADELGVDCAFLEARCDPEVAIARLERRTAAGRDPSDAGPELHRPSLLAFENLSEWPEDRHAVVKTDAPSWRAQLRQTLQRLGGQVEPASRP